MNADVCSHVLRADLKDAVLVDAARVRPLGDDVVDDALAQVLRHRILGGRFAINVQEFLQKTRINGYNANNYTAKSNEAFNAIH